MRAAYFPRYPRIVEILVPTICVAFFSFSSMTPSASARARRADWSCTSRCVLVVFSMVVDDMMLRMPAWHVPSSVNSCGENAGIEMMLLRGGGTHQLFHTPVVAAVGYGSGKSFVPCLSPSAIRRSCPAGVRGGRGRRCGRHLLPAYNPDMTAKTTSTYPFTLEVKPNPGSEGSWQWAIRKNDKLFQRSDRAQPSEAKARSQGEATIEKLLHGGGDART